MAAAHFDHPNVAAAHDYGRIDEGSFFLVLEYVEGEELRAALEQAKGPLPLARALYIGRQLASALVRAHELGIVHRDLKPENVMLVKREGHGDFVKVLDFGLAQVSRRINDEDPSEGATPQPTRAPTKLTKRGDIFGTPAYMAPEQSVGEDTDVRTDLYALGIILYELITGQRPLRGKSLLVLGAAVAGDGPCRPPRSLAARAGCQVAARSEASDFRVPRRSSSSGRSSRGP